jgi:hypothetical protein
MSVGDVEAELKKAMQLQISTSAALTQAVQDKLKAEADLKTAMVSEHCSKLKHPHSRLAWPPLCVQHWPSCVGSALLT